MNTSKNKQVQDFLEDMMNLDESKYEVFQVLRNIVFGIDDSIEERIIYGWIMFTAESDFWGIYASKNHISFIFSNGYLLNDPDKILEWGWKFRRHIKIEDFSDIKNKDVESFVKQALINL